MDSKRNELLIANKVGSLNAPSNESNDNKIILDEHEKVLQYTLLQCRKWILLTILFAFVYSIRWYIWILYAQSLGEYNNYIISIVLYSIFILNGLSSLFWSWLGDKYTFDEIMITIIIANFAGYILQFT